MESVNIPGLPAPLRWYNQPAHLDWTSSGELQITAGPKTDWFIDPQGSAPTHNAPALLFPSWAPCLLSAQVTVDYVTTYDAGALLIYQHPSLWAKLCLELSPQGELTIVSVVTREVSDDCNAFAVPGKSGYLRVARLERACALHYSEDGKAWRLIRYFMLGSSPDVALGFLAQSPMGAACTAGFAGISYEQRLLQDIRSGE